MEGDSETEYGQKTARLTTGRGLRECTAQE